jgi:hypothetical protein
MKGKHRLGRDYFEKLSGGMPNCFFTGKGIWAREFAKYDYGKFRKSNRP